MPQQNLSEQPSKYQRQNINAIISTPEYQRHNLNAMNINRSNINMKPFLATACLAADEARKITRKWFRSGVAVASKEDRSPVTIADSDTEAVIKHIILDAHPSHGFLGEESGVARSESPWQWVIDPIDGTKCFATGFPTFGTLISLSYQGIPQIGIIDHSILNERWIGVRGENTTHNGLPCSTRAVAAVNQATVYTTSIDMFDHDTAAQAELLTQKCQFRVFGGDCYSYGLIASGFNDITCEADLKPYDYFALIPVVQGAGGVITDWQGGALTMDSVGQVLACGSAKLHAEAVRILNGGAPSDKNQRQ